MDYTGLDISYHGSAYFAEAIHEDFRAGETLTAKFEIAPKNKAWADEKAQHTCCM